MKTKLFTTSQLISVIILIIVLATLAVYWIVSSTGINPFTLYAVNVYSMLFTAFELFMIFGFICLAIYKFRKFVKGFKG